MWNVEYLFLGEEECCNLFFSQCEILLKKVDGWEVDGSLDVMIAPKAKKSADEMESEEEESPDDDEPLPVGVFGEKNASWIAVWKTLAWSLLMEGKFEVN